MEILAVVIPLSILSLLLASWAHFANERQTLAVLLYLVFGGFSALLIVLGVAGSLLVDDLQRELGEEVLTSTDLLFLAGIGVAIGLPLLPPVRALVARLIPINPRSMPDMVGLSIMSGVVVMMVWSIEVTDADTEIGPVGPAELVLQAVLLMIIAFFAVGGAINRDLSSVRERLGLEMPSARQVVISIALIVPIFIVSGIGGALTEVFQPDFLEEIDDVMGEVTRDVSNLQGALLLGVTAGVGEEMLFRGAIQPRYGIIFTSILFGVTHVQYGFSFVLAGVFFTSIILGIQRAKMNTTCCMITHAAYNFAAVMLSTLAAGG